MGMVAIEQTNGELVSTNFFSAWLGFREMGWEIIYFDRGQLETVPADPRIVIVGCIPSVWTGLKRLGKTPTIMPSIPPTLASFAGRETWHSTLGEVRRNVQDGGDPLFMKPVPGQTKLFTGHVVCKFLDLLATSALPPETPVECSTVVRFQSEYRCFVHQGRIIGAKHYFGNFRVVPDFSVADAAVASYVGAPVGYLLDIGLTDEARTLLVEVNDGYSFGGYGFNPALYAQLVADRWEEMVAE